MLQRSADMIWLLGVQHCELILHGSIASFDPSTLTLARSLDDVHTARMETTTSLDGSRGDAVGSKRRYANAFRLIGIGLGVWTLAVAGCGLALGFWSLAVCRMLVGIGEASFVALASPFIGETVQ